MRIARNRTKSELDFSHMKKVLIIRLGKIGDIVVTSFVFEIFKSNYPQIDIPFRSANRIVQNIDNKRCFQYGLTYSNILM